MLAFLQGTAAFHIIYEASGAALTVICEVLRGSWIEGLVVAVALHVYLSQTRQSSLAVKPKKQPRGDCEKFALRSSPQSGSTRKGKAQKGCKGLSIPSPTLSRKGEEAQKVHRFVSYLLGRVSRPGTEALIQYKELVNTHHIDLSHHIVDDHQARAIYVALIGAVVSLSIAPPTATYSQGGPPRMPQLLADMKAFGFPRTLDFYATAQKLLLNGRLMQEALGLHDAMVKDGLYPNVAMLIGFMNAAVVRDETEKAIALFEDIARLGPPTMRTYMTVLRVYGKRKDWKTAVSLLPRMRALGTPPDNLVLNNVLGLCVAAGQVDAAERLMFEWKDITDVISCNILLKGLAQQANLERTEAVLSRMEANGPEPNLITFNTAMDCAVRALQAMASADKASRWASFHAEDSSGQTFAAVARRPWAYLDRLQKLGLQPDRYTCSTLVKGMHLGSCSVHDIDRAVGLLRQIGPKALQSPGAGTHMAHSCNARLLEVLFNTLLDACVTVKDLDRMASIFAMMQEFQVGVSAVTFGTLIKAFGQAGWLGRCQQVWKDMLEAGIHPTIVTYGCYIDACIRNEDTSGAEEVFGSMVRQGVRPNAVIYTTLIRGFAHARKPGKALDLYRRMRAENIEASSVTFNSVLDVVARQLAEPATLQEVLHDMQKAGIAPDAVTYSILIKASCSAGNVRNAISLFKNTLGHGLVFDQVAFNTLLLACSKEEQVHEAEEIFEEMRRQGLTPTHVTTSIMLKMYGKAKMLDKAETIARLMEEEYGMRPNLFVYTCLIQACAQNKHVRRSWEVFNRMLLSGVEPDAITYGTVIHGCVYLNKFEHAMSLVRHAYLKPSPEGLELESPFETQAIPLARPVCLQPEVLQMLLAALRRKEQTALAEELQAIMDENPHAGDGSGAGGYTAMRRSRHCRRGVSDDLL